jgi:hypothetical protein
MSEWYHSPIITAIGLTKEEELVRVALTSSFREGGEEGGKGIAVAAYKFSTYVLFRQEQNRKYDNSCHK